MHVYLSGKKLKIELKIYKHVEKKNYQRLERMLKIFRPMGPPMGCYVTHGKRWAHGPGASWEPMGNLWGESMAGPMGEGHGGTLNGGDPVFGYFLPTKLSRTRLTFSKLFELSLFILNAFLQDLAAEAVTIGMAIKKLSIGGL